MYVDEIKRTENENKGMSARLQSPHLHLNYFKYYEVRFTYIDILSRANVHPKLEDAALQCKWRP